MSEVAPGSAVVVSIPDVRDGLLARGAEQVRHVHTMRHDLRDLPLRLGGTKNGPEAGV